MTINRSELQAFYDSQIGSLHWMIENMPDIDTENLLVDREHLQTMLPAFDGYLEELRVVVGLYPGAMSQEDFEWSTEKLQRMIDMSYTRLNAVLAELSSRGVHTGT